jgi:hypothetical protein
MKPFLRTTALVIAVLFLSGATYTVIDLVSRPDILGDPELKVSFGWLSTGLIFLALGLRGWRSRKS